MRHRRLLFVQTQAENAGAQEIARILGGGLEAQGYEVHHAFFYRRTDGFDSAANTHFCAMSRPNSIAGVLKVVTNLHRHIRTLRPDAVLCFQHYGNLIAAPISRLAGQKVVIANQNTARSQMRPWVVYADMLLGAIGIYSRIVVNSDTTRHEYDWEPTGYQRRVVRIDHGFSPKPSKLQRARARGSFGLPTEGPIAGCVARLHPDKNQAAAIRAIALRPNYGLAFMGQGGAETELRSLAADLGCSDRVHFVGEHPPERVGDFLRCLDVFVFPSRMETFGLAAVEAAETGLPVVSNDHPVMREVLEVDGAPCALFVDVEQPETFAKAIDQAMSDQPTRDRLAALGPRLRERYSLAAMVKGYDELISEALGKAKLQPA